MGDIGHLAMTAERERCRRLALEMVIELRRTADEIGEHDANEAWSLLRSAMELERLAVRMADGAYTPSYPDLRETRQTA